MSTLFHVIYRFAAQEYREPSGNPNSLGARLLPTILAALHVGLSTWAYSAVAAAPLLQLPQFALLLQALATNALVCCLASGHELLHSRNKVHLGVAEFTLAWIWWHPYFRRVRNGAA